MGAPLIGARIQRKEDYRFLTGAGQYTDDVTLQGQTHAVFVRSPHAHAKIKSIRKDKALKAPGVLAVFTGEDLAAAKVGGLPCGWLITDVNGQPMKEPPHPCLAQGKVRYVGDHVAVVIAETLDGAQDAAELVEVDYEVLPAVADASLARAKGAPVLHDIAPDNTCYVWALGDKAAADAAFAKAAHVTKLEFINNRLIPNAIEPRAAIGSYSRSEDAYTLYVSNQNPHVERLLMAAFVLGLPEHKLRVVAPDVGGGFGSKIYLYAEDVVVTWASKQINRPVKWTADRSESFVSDAHGRDHHTIAELAMDKDGKFLAMRVKTTANMGAYLSTFASAIPTILYATLLAGQYTTPVIHVEVTAVFTNTAPVDAYRGAGRPEATYVVERLVETAAREMKLDPAEIRRRNFIKNFPYQTPVALLYDIGDYEATMAAAIKLADVAGFPQRRKEAEARGKLRGLGYAAYIEACGIAPSAVAGSLGARAGLFEAGEIRVHPTGSVTVFTGSHSHGQGHETTFAQVVADRFGLPIESVDIVHGDTSKILFGMGTYGSRSLAVGGTAIVKAMDKIIAKGKKIAAHLLEAAESDIEYDQRRIQGGRHRQEEDVRRGGVRGLRAAQLPARQARARPERERVLRSVELHLPRGHLRLRSRDRPGHRRHQGGQLHRGGRFRQDHQPDDRRGPGARRHHAGHRPGADRRLPLRCHGAADHGLVHGLLHPARRRRALLQGGHARDALHAQPARRQGLRRSRRHRRAGGPDERDHGRARHQGPAHACDPADGVESTAEQEGCLRRTPCTHSTTTAPAM